MKDDSESPDADEYGGCGYCWTDEEYKAGEPVLGGGCGYCMTDEQYKKRFK